MSIKKRVYGNIVSSAGMGIGTLIPAYPSGTKIDSNSFLEICPGDADYQLRCRIKDLTVIYNYLNTVQYHSLNEIHRNIINKVKKFIISNPYWKLSAFRRRWSHIRK